MTASERDNVLEERLRQAKPVDMGPPDFIAWRQRHREEIECLQSQARQRKRGAQHLSLGFRVWGRTAAAVLLLMGLAYVLGRFSGPPTPDVEQLRSELETSLRQDVIQPIGVQWRETLQANCDQLRTEILLQLQHDLADLATQTLAASASITDQRMTELIQLIETARQRERQRVAMALEQIESQRRRDRVQLGSGLQLLVARGVESADWETE